MGKIPQEAKREMLERLLEHQELGSDEIVSILKRHGVQGDEEAVQRRYLKQLGQQYLAGIRDEEGNREVLAVRDGTGAVKYTIVGLCNSKKELQSIRSGIQHSMQGLHNTETKVASRIHVIDRMLARFRKVGLQ